MSAGFPLRAVEHESDQGPSARPAVSSILVVDDDAAKRLALRAILAPLGHDIVEADSGEAALWAIRSRRFAVILMDVRMPVVDGYETAKLIRQQSEMPMTPIIFVTGFGYDEIETTAAYAIGAVDFIFAPIAPTVLEAKVSALVELFEQAEELRHSLESITTLHGALRESEVRARAVLENVADGIVTADEAGRIESLNSSAQRLFGYRERDVVGEPLDVLLAIPGHVSPGETADTIGHRNDGSSFPIEMSLSEMHIGDRMVTIGCIRDTSGRTERAEVERRRGQALRREAQRDRAAFEEAPIGSVIASRDGRVERVNQALCKMTGYTADELIGTHLLDLTHLADLDGSGSNLATLLSEGSATRHYEKRYVLPNGRVLEGRVAITAIRDDAHQVTQVFAQIEDVTDARRTSRELEQSQFEMLARLAAVAEFRDDATGQHTRRVGDLSVAIAQRLGLPESDIELIRLAAPLHDVGKIAIPDALLEKPGSLTNAEFDQMKTHTNVGAEMLSGSGFALLEMAEQIALTHHERWDGSGYPIGLAGDAIPIAGRIVAVADVFDALTHSRPYKDAWSADAAIAEMTSQSGRHFDPDVLDAFLSRPTNWVEKAAPSEQIALSG